ncbi:hypothetical protein SSP35_05_04510 [Streptomyces sp. NBRC 110611]|uniref:hypothetical protein n=1 Tax=Streptomyces sp. NBRC 110611 TaxID=1621259 RepID=UPI000855B841|nr:hypothetical protein [Streptomyces sp. NBRC 110611]GAU67884.1 hypothetical protein SSP35_05_04510 [Streptomyces sp. NBRC 110611]
MSVTLTEQDKFTLRIAARGAVTLMSATDAAGKPHRVATDGAIALGSATGLVGHVLAKHPQGKGLNGKSSPPYGRDGPQDHRSPRRRLMGRS